MNKGESNFCSIKFWVRQKKNSAKVSLGKKGVGIYRYFPRRNGITKNKFSSMEHLYLTCEGLKKSLWPLLAIGNISLQATVVDFPKIN